MYNSVIDSGINERCSNANDLNFLYTFRAVHFCSLLFIVINPAFGVIYFGVGATFLFYWMLGTSVLCIGNIAFLRKTQNAGVASHALAFIFIIQILGECLSTGGYLSPGIIWFFIVPVGAGFVISFRASFFYGIISGISIVTLFIVHRFSGESTSVIPADYSELYLLLHLSMLLMATVILVFGFQRAYTRTLLTLFIAEKQSREVSIEKEKNSRVKSRFLATMSHEIRTPMNGIISMMQMLLNTPLNDEQKKYADVVYNSADSLMVILNDILDLSKIEAGKLEFDIRDFDLGIALKDMNALFTFQAGQKNIRYSCQIEPDVPVRLKGDPGRLRQILTNLTANAIKFTDAGEVAVTIKLESETNKKVTLDISVRDTGVGIPADALPNLFASFTQADAATSEKYGGTGLGLSISKMLVEQMAGTIQVESDEFLGSTFRFTVALEKQQEHHGVQRWGTLAISGDPLILVCEQSSMRYNLQKKIETLGFQVKLIDRYETVFRVHDRESYPLVLVDSSAGTDTELLKLPTAWSRHDCSTRFVYLASTGEKGDGMRFEQAGYDAYLSKPILPSVLKGCIRMILAETDGEERNDKQFVTRHSFAESLKEGVRILVAEDNETNRIVSEELLKKLGYTADYVKNGRDAVDKYKQANYDIVFMDCQMPLMDGFEATMHIRELESEKKRTPVVAMTANAMKGAREKCLQAGMDDYISKPVSPYDLRECLTKYTADTTIEPIDENTEKKEWIVSDVPAATEHDNETTLKRFDKETMLSRFDKETMLSRFGGNKALVTSVVGVFLNESEGLIEKIKKAATENNRELLREYSHALHGSSANVNASILEQAASLMEHAVELNDTSEFVTIANRIDEEFIKLKEEIVG